MVREHMIMRLRHSHYKKTGLLRLAKTATKAQKIAAKGSFGLLRRFHPPALHDNKKRRNRSAI